MYAIFVLITCLVQCLADTTVNSRSSLVSALSSNTVIYFANNIAVTSVVSVSSLSSIEIDGQGFKIDGSGSSQCFDIESSSVTLTSLQVTNCDSTNVRLPR